jgi:hypothetical protein
MQNYLRRRSIVWLVSTDAVDLARQAIKLRPIRIECLLVVDAEENVAQFLLFACFLVWLLSYSKLFLTTSTITDRHLLLWVLLETTIGVCLHQFLFQAISGLIC